MLDDAYVPAGRLSRRSLLLDHRLESLDGTVEVIRIFIAARQMHMLQDDRPEAWPIALYHACDVELRPMLDDLTIDRAARSIKHPHRQTLCGGGFTHRRKHRLPGVPLLPGAAVWIDRAFHAAFLAHGHEHRRF